MSPPTAADRQGAKPPAVSSATLRIVGEPFFTGVASPEHFVTRTSGRAWRQGHRMGWPAPRPDLDQPSRDRPAPAPCPPTWGNAVIAGAAQTATPDPEQ